MEKTNTITVTLEIPQSWKNAAWYEEKQIDTDWIREQIEDCLSYKVDHFGVTFDVSEHKFQSTVTIFREERAKYQQAQDELWKDPEYRKAKWDEILKDDLPEYFLTLEDIARKSTNEIKRKLELILTGDES